MRRLYRLAARLARRLVALTGRDVPRPIRRLNRYVRRLVGDAPPRSEGQRHKAPTPGAAALEAELEALNRRVERLETQAYLETIGRYRD